MYGRYGRGYKRIGTCGSCGQDVYGPLVARYLGTTKSCKKCRGLDASDLAEREYFRKLSAEYQMEVQGFVSTP